MNGILRFFVLITGIYAIFRYRYRLVNTILGNRTLRKWLVATTMNIPSIRERFIRSSFRY